jgi:hypothetical protein
MSQHMRVLMHLHDSLLPKRVQQLAGPGVLALVVSSLLPCFAGRRHMQGGSHGDSNGNG